MLGLEALHPGQLSLELLDLAGSAFEFADAHLEVVDGRPLLFQAMDSLVELGLMLVAHGDSLAARVRAVAPGSIVVSGCSRNSAAQAMVARTSRHG